MMVEVECEHGIRHSPRGCGHQAESRNIAEDLGLDLSSVTRAFYKQIVREKRIPLNPSYTIVPPETMEALDEAKNRLADGQPRFNSADEMFDSLGI